MKKIKKYKYQGVNGTIISSILLEGINNTILYDLKADEGYTLTDGINQLKHAVILAVDLDKWSEIKDNSNK